MSPKSQAIVGFLANLIALYEGERRDDVWCARSLADGTLIFPVDETDWDEERGTVRVWWQGDAQRGIETDDSNIVKQPIRSACIAVADKATIVAI